MFSLNMLVKLLKDKKVKTAVPCLIKIADISNHKSTKSLVNEGSRHFRPKLVH